MKKQFPICTRQADCEPLQQYLNFPHVTYKSTAYKERTSHVLSGDPTPVGSCFVLTYNSPICGFLPE